MSEAISAIATYAFEGWDAELHLKRGKAHGLRSLGHPSRRGGLILGAGHNPRTHETPTRSRLPVGCVSARRCHGRLSSLELTTAGEVWERVRLVAAVAAVLLLGACGGGGESADPATSRVASTTSTLPATTTTVATTASTLPATTTTVATTVTQPDAASDDFPGQNMELTSSAFEHEGVIPEPYTCDGSDVSPPLTLRDIPAAAVSLVLVLDDPDAPGGVWDHWIAYNIPTDNEIAEAVGSLGKQGLNSWGRTDYGGPCPPSGIHRYIFSVYALDANLELESGANKADVLDALSDHVLAEATLMGRYSR